MASSLLIPTLTVEAMYALRKASYEVPDRVTKMLARLVIAVPVAPPRGSAAPSAGGWNTVGGRRSNGGYRGGRDGGNRRWGGGGYDSGWRASSDASDPAMQRKVRITDNATRDKATSILNKISKASYDGMKVQLAAILEEFPDDVPLITNIAETMFSLASRSSVLAPIYARLIQELDNQLLMNITIKTYQAYLETFKVPFKHIDPNTEYDAFCAQNKQKSERRGFATFIVELHRVRVLQTGDVQKVSDGLVEMLQADARASASNQEQVQEYVECLFGIAGSLPPTSPVKKRILGHCKDILTIPKPDLPGLSMRSRFRLQDIVEGRGAK